MHPELIAFIALHNITSQMDQELRKILTKEWIIISLFNHIKSEKAIINDIQDDSKSLEWKITTVSFYLKCLLIEEQEECEE